MSGRRVSDAPGHSSGQGHSRQVGVPLRARPCWHRVPLPL